jgi:hypothetical protein
MISRKNALPTPSIVHHHSFKGAHPVYQLEMLLGHIRVEMTYCFIQGDQKASMHLMITVQKHEKIL